MVAFYQCIGDGSVINNVQTQVSLFCYCIIFYGHFTFCGG